MIYIHMQIALNPSFTLFKRHSIVILNLIYIQQKVVGVKYVQIVNFFPLINIVELSPNDSTFWALKISNCAGGEKWHIGRLYNDIFYVSLRQKWPIVIHKLSGIFAFLIGYNRNQIFWAKCLF